METEVIEKRSIFDGINRLSGNESRVKFYTWIQLKITVHLRFQNEIRISLGYSVHFADPLILTRLKQAASEFQRQWKLPGQQWVSVVSNPVVSIVHNHDSGQVRDVIVRPFVRMANIAVGWNFGVFSIIERMTKSCIKLMRFLSLPSLFFLFWLRIIRWRGKSRLNDDKNDKGSQATRIFPRKISENARK